MSTLFRFRIDLSDVERGVYEALDFRVALHPSETMPYLLSRVLAFALNASPDLAFSPGGLSDPDAPAMQEPGPNGSIALWIEIGNPSARKLHRATKAARAVRVYTYKDPVLLREEIASNDVHQAERIEIYALNPRFLDRLAETVEKDNAWNVLRSDGTLSVACGEFSESIEIARL